jgi:hypothetical protein
MDGRIRSGHVIEVLSRLIAERGAPLYLRSDNGPEFVAQAPLKWIAEVRRCYRRWSARWPSSAPTLQAFRTGEPPTHFVTRAATRAAKLTAHGVQIRILPNVS